MTEFLLLALTATQIPFFFILMARLYCRTYNGFAVRKNPEWFEAHPEFTAHLTAEKLFIGFSYVISIASLVGIARYFYTETPPSYLIFNLMAPVTAFVVAQLLHMAFLYYRVFPTIPVMENRKASLTDRSLATHVPLWIVYLAYFLLALILGTYVSALLGQTIELEIIVRRLTGIGVVAAGATALLLFALRRKHSELEPFFGKAAQKIEVRLVISVLYLGVFVGAYRILGDFYGILLFSEASFFIVVSILVQGWVITLYLKSKSGITHKPDIHASS